MSVRGEPNRPPVPATVTSDNEPVLDYRAYTEPRIERCMCGGTVRAGGLPPEVLQRVSVHNRTQRHRAYSQRVHRFLHDDSPRSDTGPRDLSAQGPDASAGVVEGEQ